MTGLLCRERMSKIEQSELVRDTYRQLMLIYLHLSYHGRRCHQHRYLVSTEQRYRLRIFYMFSQDMGHLTT